MMENPQHKPFHVLSMFVLMAVAATAVGAILSTGWGHREDTSTREEAESLALQLANSQYLEMAKKTESRGPASVGPIENRAQISPSGQIGRDQWGTPYNYRLMATPDRQTLVVAVWSVGANQRNDSQKNMELSPSSHQIEYVGDDVGVTLSLPIPK